MDKIKKLTKSVLLEITLNGWLYFVMLFPELLTAKRNERSCRNIINHFRGERKASLSCYFKGDCWYLHDHADPDFSGDMFSIYQDLNDTSDFKISMKGIFEETFNQEAPEIVSDKSTSKVKMEESELADGVKYEIEEISFDALGDEEKKFLEKHGLSIEDFKENNSVFLASYTLRAQSGKVWKIFKPDGEVFIGYKYRGSVKVYKPYDEEHKFLWLGDKPNDYVYGLPKLKELYNRLNNNKTDEKVQVVVCAGEKDTLVTNSLGYTAVCLNSETSTYFPENLSILLMGINDFCNKNLELIILYDRDKTGEKQAERIAKKQSEYFDSIRIVELPEVLIQNGGKDVSDWITLGLSESDLKTQISGNDMPSSVSPISPQEYNLEIINDDVNSSIVEEPELTYEQKQDLTSSKKLRELSMKDSRIHLLVKHKRKNKNTSFDNTEDNTKGGKEEVADERVKTGVIINKEISETVFKQLPELFQGLCKPFESHFKEMMLFSFITSIGSILRNVKGKFRNDKLFPNLFTCVIAPPASGKNNMKWAKYIIMPIERFLDNESKNKLAEYNRQQDQVIKGEIERKEAMAKPPYQLHFVSTDITSSMWMLQIQDNGGYGLMYDTEIDGLVNSNNGSLLSFTDKMRKIYENEELSLMRKTDRERIVIEEGKMALLLSGTPQQFLKLTPDTENGMFSRLITYNLKSNVNWMSSYDENAIDFEQYFNKYAYQIAELFQLLLGREESITVDFTKKQLQKLDDEFTKRLDFVLNNIGDEGRATVMRLGAITMKIAMIFTVIRFFENDDLSDTIICSDTDFNTSLYLSGVILHHIIKTLRVMNDERIESSFRGKKLDFFYALPNDFTYAESQELADEHGVKLRTAQKWVYEFRNKGFLINSEKGKFKKLD